MKLELVKSCVVSGKLQYISPVGVKVLGGDLKNFKKQCPLRPSEIENMWHMMKNQNSPFFAQRYLMVAL